MKSWIFATVSLAMTMLTSGCARTHGHEMLKTGTQAPALSGVDQNGTTHTLAQQRGKPIVVYFYPKDATPGCTKEACAFRDVWDKYQAAGVQVFGVSSDDQASHAKFAAAQKIPFPIIADPQHEWIAAFGVPTRLGFASRVSFLIGPDGRIAKVYPNVDPGVHATQVLQDAQGLQK